MMISRREVVEAFQLCSLCLPLESSHSRDHAANRYDHAADNDRSTDLAEREGRI